MAQQKALPQESLGLRLKLARVRAGMTLKELEKATGYAESVLSRYERNKADVPTRRLQRIAEALGTTASDLLNGVAAFHVLGRYLGAELVLSGQAA